MTFDGTQKVIGKGAQAEVFLYHGFAYKVYNESYPADWIVFEKRQQQAVNKAGLCPVKYYDTDDPHIIKMDLVKGSQLEKAVPKAPEQGFALLARAFRFVHQADASNTTIPPLSSTAGLMLTEEEKSEVLPIIERLSQKYKSCICHLDMHFLNIMIPDDAELIADKINYTIIDWMNTRLAPAVFDYARTYVILNEFAKEAVDFYKATVWSDILSLGISEDDFFEAVKVCTVLRSKEK
ncbi:MAG: phosphotransferase [Treponema sp.]|nr:phosphotransferase [Treponema sp.]